MNQSEKKIKLPSVSTLLIYTTVIYIIGVAGLLIEGTRPLFIFLVPLNILLATILVLLFTNNPSRQFFLASIVVMLGGYGVEWLGVESGIIFGAYHYEYGLGPHIFGVPPMMGINWFLLVYGSSTIASRFNTNKWLQALIGATLMVFYDIFLEPSAIKFKFWIWDSGQIPFQNYLAWWVLGFIFIRLFQTLSAIKSRNIMAEAMFWMQLGFFIILWIFNNLAV